LDAGVTGTASATSGGGGGVRDLVGIGVAVRVLANEEAGRGLRRSRSSSELLARAEELGGEPYDGNGGRRSSACGRASYGGGGDARGEGKGGRSSPWGHTVARWVTRSSSGVDSGRRRSSEPRAKARSWRCGGAVPVRAARRGGCGGRGSAWGHVGEGRGQRWPRDQQRQQRRRWGHGRRGRCREVGISLRRHSILGGRHQGRQE